MIDLLAILTLSLILLVLLVRGLAKRPRMLQFPFLFAAIMAGWFLPQAFLLMDRSGLPPQGFALTIAYAAVCSLAVLAADYRTERWRHRETPVFNERKLLFGAAFLSVTGAIAYNGILTTPASQTADGLTTGIVTIYFFFYQLQYFGLALSLLLLLRGRSNFAFALGLVIFNFATISGFILFGGRRGPLVEVALITATALWFQWRLVPPRSVVILGLSIGALFVVSAGEYRSTVQQINQEARFGVAESRLPTLDELTQINFVESFVQYDDRRTDEVRNAIYDVSATTQTLELEFASGYWNYLVFRYVPAQFLGEEVKTSLQFSELDLAYATFGYEKHLGTTSTGFSDSFRAFFFLGAIVFFAIAIGMKWLWFLGVRGDIRAQYFYSILIATAVMSLTHGTDWFIGALPQAIIFSIPIFVWARQQKHASKAGLRPLRPTAMTPVEQPCD